MALAGETIERLRDADAGDIAVFVGGTIPAADRAALQALGVSGVFTADMRTEDVIDAIAARLAAP